MKGFLSMMLVLAFFIYFGYMLLVYESKMEERDVLRRDYKKSVNCGDVCLKFRK